jgi:hypothetical protein
MEAAWQERLQGLEARERELTAQDQLLQGRSQELAERRRQLEGLEEQLLAREQALEEQVQALSEQARLLEDEGRGEPVPLSAGQIVGCGPGAVDDTTDPRADDEVPLSPEHRSGTRGVAVNAIDMSELDAEVAGAILMLRRMGVEGDDRELLEQAQLEVAHRRAAMERARESRL